MKSLSKTLLINPKQSEHTWADSKCSFCNKTMEELFWELVWKYEDDEALKYIYGVQSLGRHFYEHDRDRIVETRHKYCLTQEEMIVRDIIV